MDVITIFLQFQATGFKKSSQVILYLSTNSSFLKDLYPLLSSSVVNPISPILISGERKNLSLLSLLYIYKRLELTELIPCLRWKNHC